MTFLGFSGLEIDSEKPRIFKYPEAESSSREAINDFLPSGVDKVRSPRQNSTERLVTRPSTND